jgi:tetratricopeptide (TPR) repeat protein
MRRFIIGLLFGLLLTNCNEKKEDKKSSDELLKEIGSTLTAADTVKTIELLEQHNKLYPDNLETQAVLTVIKMQSGTINKDDAFKTIRELYLKDSTNELIAGFYSNTIVENGTLEEGLREIEKRLDNNPNDFWDNYERGKKLMELERYEEALKAFDKAQEIEPENRYPYADKALVKFKMGDKIGACKDWRAKECVSYLEKYCQ